MDSGADARRAWQNLGRLSERQVLDGQLPVEIATRLLEHLDGLRITPGRILVLGGGAGLLHALLTDQFPQAQLVYADPVAQALARMPRRSRLQRWLGSGAEPVRLACRPSALPLRNGCIDLVVALGVLGWESPEAVFREARRVLTQDGLLLFHALGPDTLREWCGALAEACPGRDPVGRSVLRLMDMHDLADAAGQAGLGSPVVDMERLTVHYSSVESLVADLRASGGNGLRDRPRGLMTPRQYRRLIATLDRGRTAEGLPVTLEAIYGHAWNTHPLVDGAGRAVIPIRAAGPPGMA